MLVTVARLVYDRTELVLSGLVWVRQASHRPKRDHGSET